MTLNRRQFLMLLGAATGAASLGLAESAESLELPFRSAQTPSEVFKLPPLPYAYDALEPFIDAETMQFHHDKHHAAYVKNLNAAVNKYPELKVMTAEGLLRQIQTLPADVRTAVTNNGGGHVNHSMFWEIMSPTGGGRPTDSLAAAIRQSFGSFEAFQTAFNEAGTQRFGSGWAWLVMQPNGDLQVTSTGNQDSPLMSGLFPIMGNDVWEHAYYLKYRNKRDEYLNNWWNVVNWPEVERRYQQAMTEP
ncbi:MAG: superoxide dismutase [Pegethrix bostrychoides GSE-TBD4-15B]|jgi:Fe-Mn family superoxide dismutase|uniref:Superoxide dismutase n=1 Tax=Pegethrix bostrychoides GSE-TBD4-15B TaxID=2839662 RepID=A0A951U363_9CYAN|nr:superoxide dismutase [Pegethrix bostrychoides GSE-TBD4-15B]